MHLFDLQDIILRTTLFFLERDDLLNVSATCKYLWKISRKILFNREILTDNKFNITQPGYNKFRANFIRISTFGNNIFSKIQILSLSDFDNRDFFLSNRRFNPKILKNVTELYVSSRYMYVVLANNLPENLEILSLKCGGWLIIENSNRILKKMREIRIYSDKLRIDKSNILTFIPDSIEKIISGCANKFVSDELTGKILYSLDIIDRKRLKMVKELSGGNIKNYTFYDALKLCENFKLRIFPTGLSFCKLILDCKNFPQFPDNITIRHLTIESKTRNCILLNGNIRKLTLAKKFKGDMLLGNTFTLKILELINQRDLDRIPIRMTANLQGLYLINYIIKNIYFDNPNLGIIKLRNCFISESFWEAIAKLDRNFSPKYLIFHDTNIQDLTSDRLNKIGKWIFEFRGYGKTIKEQFPLNKNITYKFT